MQDDEDDDDVETPLFQHESNSSNPANKSQYFGGFTLQAPSTKLNKNKGQ